MIKEYGSQSRLEYRPHLRDRKNIDGDILDRAALLPHAVKKVVFLMGFPVRGMDLPRTGSTCDRAPKAVFWLKKIARPKFVDRVSGCSQVDTFITP